MHLKQLFLQNFKNYNTVSLSLPEKIICITGENGSGKTNLLDAIHYLCLCKSYFNFIDTQNINHDKDFFRIDGVFEKNGEDQKISCTVAEGRRKVFKKNKAQYEKLSEHIGQFPAVVVAPDDQALIYGGSEERRKFLDNTLSQLDKNYLENLQAYNKVLAQRNAALKRFAEKHSFDHNLISSYDEKLVETGMPVFEKRKAFFDDFLPLLQEHYEQISDGKEHVSCGYESDLEKQEFSELLKQNREKDKLLQRTSAGIHKDDLHFEINTYPVKKFGSQGQQKSFLFALKLAQYAIIRERKKMMPVLLLDDVYDKLDDKRVKQLLELLFQNPFGQIFITDTKPGRIASMISNNFNITPREYIVEAGNIL